MIVHIFAYDQKLNELFIKLLILNLTRSKEVNLKQFAASKRKVSSLWSLQVPSFRN